MENFAGLSRRHLLLATAAGGYVALNAGTASAARANTADLIATSRAGTVEVTALSDRAVRVRCLASADFRAAPGAILLAQAKKPKVRRRHKGQVTRLSLAHLHCEWDDETQCLSFFDGSGKLLLRETAGSRSLSPSTVRGMPVLAAQQGFESPPDEYLFGTGCFQDGYLNLRGLPRRLTQVNTQISLPFVLSSKGYGLLWHNTGMAEFNRATQPVRLDKRADEAAAKSADVTTTGGNARVTRRAAIYEGHFDIATAGRYAFQLDIGRKMASRHYVEIDGKVCTDLDNLWLPPTTSFITDLEAGRHDIKVLANSDDAPTISFRAVTDETTWWSPVAEAVDYVVIAGPSAEEVMAGYRDIAGATPMMPRWAYGYIHCRERFHSSAEILETAAEFRKRKLPVDVMVQDWQYWGKHGWNAMRFDEEHYPDPAGLVRDLHGMDMRLMLSVWSKISRDTELGKAFAAKGFYIPQTDWVDFFNPKAADFYWENQKSRLASLGIDAWWQDATEPENDDLDGRDTAAGAGERLRLAYPLQVARTVYEGQRRDFPDRRVMVLTRSAFAGQQRYGAATWSGDIGNDWETLKRQIPAGLNMAAAGYAYWTVDAGGFFRPGEGQYTDVAYHERFIRWFQYATFLPLQRVHGYMTNTEFWRYGETVETVSRQFLELRYRLLPYTYSLAAQATTRGTPIIRPLVFDFAGDDVALRQSHSYMYGPALHIAPVLSAGARTCEVYLPATEGGWFDFWSGQPRSGGRMHTVATPLEQLPVHVRAGSIVPVGPVMQSTAQWRNTPISLYVCPGRDGVCELYDDDGTSYGYEGGASSTVTVTWNEQRQELSLSRRRGGYAGMSAQQRFTIYRMGPGTSPMTAGEEREVVYDGKPMVIALG